MGLNLKKSLSLIGIFAYNLLVFTIGTLLEQNITSLDIFAGKCYDIIRGIVMYIIDVHTRLTYNNEPSSSSSYKLHKLMNMQINICAILNEIEELIVVFVYVNLCAYSNNL